MSGVKLQAFASLADHRKPSKWVDYEHSEVQKYLAANSNVGLSEEAVIQADFEFVRDQVAHSWDIGSRRVTGPASEVLRHREGICYAKSHLLAALLRGRGIPAGLCYQKLTLGDTPESGYCLHALNAVWIESRQAWIQLDARGNKPGIDAQLSLDGERLAFVVRPEYGEEEYGVIYAEPPPQITQALETHQDCRVMCAQGLPTDLQGDRRLKNYVLFDLGNTLVSYYERSDFPSILQAAITEVEGFLGVKADWEQVQAEKFTAKDFSVRPLAERLRRIFPNAAWSEEATAESSRRFMRPIFALASVYEDVLPTLEALRAKGIQTAIVSNTPWGSPAVLWREELVRLGLVEAVDLTVFCGDCGWRKPARQIFEYTLDRLGATPEQCVFVGDDPRWDIVGPQSVGMEALLIDRRTQNLAEVLKGTITP